MHNSTLRLLYSVILSALLLVGFGWQAQAQSDGNQGNAEVLGWAIGCGCLKHEMATVVRYMDIFFPDLSSQETEALVGHISTGVNDSREYDNSEQICSVICTAADWDELSNHLSQLN